jgi:hypothetical protein
MRYTKKKDVQPDKKRDVQPDIEMNYLSLPRETLIVPEFSELGQLRQVVSPEDLIEGFYYILMLDDSNKYYVVKYVGKSDFSGDNCLLLAFLYETNRNEWVVFRTQELRICLTNGNFMKGYKFFYLDDEENFQNLVTYPHKMLDNNPRKDYPELLPTIHKLRKIKNIDDLNIGSQYLILNGTEYLSWRRPSERPRTRPFYGILIDKNTRYLEFNTIYFFDDKNGFFPIRSYSYFETYSYFDDHADNYSKTDGTVRSIKISVDNLLEIYYYPSEQRIPIFSNNNIMKSLSLLQQKKVDGEKKFPVLVGPLKNIAEFLGGNTKHKSTHKRRKSKRRLRDLTL